MALAHSPRIVTDGLVLALDAGNTKSYNSSIASNVSLLLHGDGTNGSTAIVDSSANAHTITVNGNAQISTTQSKFGGSSMYFDGSGDYLQIAQDTSLDLGSSDFTIEAWIYPTDLSGILTIFGRWVNNSGPIFYINSSKLNFAYYVSGSGTHLAGTTILSTNTWYHVAVTREGSLFRIFLNGQVEDSHTFSPTIVNGSSSIGRWPSYSNRDFQGYIDDLRITKGVARYTDNFTPPTTALPADPAAQWTDLSGNVNNGTLVNGVGFDSNNLGSFSFDGTDDYVEVSSSALGLSAGTLCFWIKSSVVKDIYNTHSGTYNQNSLYGSGSSILLRIGDGTGNPGDVTISSSLVFDGNFHWVCTQWTTGGERSIWVDGTKRASLSGTEQYTPGTTLEIGYKSWSAGYYNGTMSNIMSFNRALSASEMQQIYNAFRGRFGI